MTIFSQEVTSHLRNRTARRRLMFRSTLVLLGLWAAGHFVLADRLARAPLFFLLHWTLVAFLALFLVVLALYDLLRVRREFHRESLDERRRGPED